MVLNWAKKYSKTHFDEYTVYKHTPYSLVQRRHLYIANIIVDFSLKHSHPLSKTGTKRFLNSFNNNIYNKFYHWSIDTTSQGPIVSM